MDKFILFLKGMFMGAADIIPGVSGGSIALITGIYDDFIGAIHSVNLNVLKEILKGNIIKGIKMIKWEFLIPIGLGILTAIFTMARLMHFFLEEYTLYTWSVFFGLIVASAYVISKQFKMNSTRAISLIVGGVTSFIIVGLVPVNTPNALWFLFIAGVIAISAMILPGISGAFLLLIMGKYHYITGMIKEPFADGNLVGLIAVALGCVVGILSFSRVLKFVLDRWHSGTMAFLTGMMIGSLRKIWPYKETLETKLVDGELFVIKEQLVAPWSVDGFAMSIVFMIIALIVIIALDKVANRNKLSV